MLQVIGSGLGRTGTLSVKLALEQLGFGPCHHMMEVIQRPETVPLWIAAGRGEADWEAIFGGYASMVDHPGCRYWRELAEVYPKAKILHTVRDPDRWFDSTQQTIFSPRLSSAPRTPEMAAFMEVVHGTYGGDLSDRAFMVDFFRRYTETVIAEAPGDRLLVFDVAQGWAPLCAFLDVPVPDTPFPRENSTEQFKARFSPS